MSANRIENLLLQAAAPDDLAALRPHLEAVPLHRGECLFNENQPSTHIWFLDTAIGSLVVLSPEGHQVEGGIFGRDGFSPVNVLYGVETCPLRCFIQLAGDGHRISKDAFIAVVEARPELKRLLLRYVHALMAQTAYTALSNAVHSVDERLARWLLMVHDRALGDELALTHEFMALMLAVRRPSVTTSLHVLEGNRLIRAERGLIIIRDRAALEQFAFDGYGPPEAVYHREIGLPLSKS